MKEECLICNAPLESLNEGIEMECAICYRKEISAARCVNGHFVCDACHTQGIGQIIGVCLKETSKDPCAIISRLMDLPFCHMRGPEHPIMVGAALKRSCSRAVRLIYWISRFL